MVHVIRANAAQNIGAVLCQELVIDLVRAARLVLVFRRNQLNSSNEARERCLRCAPANCPKARGRGVRKPVLRGSMDL
jgi:hypothetical protein